MILIVVGVVSFILITNLFEFRGNQTAKLYGKDDVEAQVLTQPNLVINPGCESNSSNWVGLNASIIRSALVNHSGLASCEVKYSGKGASYTIDDSPDSVLSPILNEIYTASVWLRSDSAVGESISLKLRQRGGVAVEKIASSQIISLTTSWQQLSLTDTINSNDRTSLDIYVVQSSRPHRNDAFFTDDFFLTLDNPPTPSPTLATPSPTPIVTPSPIETFSPSPTASPSMSPIIPGDINNSSKVDVFDYNLLIIDFGKTGTNLRSDLNKNGKVDVYDYNILMINFGRSN